MSDVPPKFQVFVDSDAFVGWLYEKDSNHGKASEGFTKIMNERQSLVTSNYVVLETATVLSHRQGQALARRLSM
jgi:predicted nucleic acid-binding protein